MKIAMFTDSFLPGIGGTENVVLKLAQILSEEHEVMVFAPSYHKPYEEKLNLPFKVARTFSIQTSKNDFWAHPKLTKGFRKKVDEFCPDVIHTHTLGMMADYANAYGKKHNIPVICTVHTKYAYCYKYAAKFDFIVKILLNRVIKRAQNADFVTSVSYSMIPELVSYGLNKDVTVIKNGIDRHCDKGFVRAEKNDKFTIIYIGTIIDYKNLGFSLKALAQLKKKTSDFVFYMVGRGPHERKFRRMIKKLGLTDNVVMTGAITDREKLYKIVTSADICLFTSIFDNDSLVLLECADAGIPVMVLKDTGSSERIKDGHNGFIVENDERAVADKLFELMDKRDYLREIGSNGCGKLVSWKEAVKEYEKVYQDLTNKKQQQVAVTKE